MRSASEFLPMQAKALGGNTPDSTTDFGRMISDINIISGTDAHEAAAYGETDTPRPPAPDFSIAQLGAGVGRVPHRSGTVGLRMATLHESTASHSNAGDMAGIAALDLPPLQDHFTMRGELIHACLSYRIATEGTVLTLHHNSAETFCPAAHSSLATHRCRSRPRETARCAGPAGNGLAERVAAKIRSLSTDPAQSLEIPQHGRYAQLWTCPLR